ncbi:hypothetical protein [Polaromonas sp. CG_9.11]|uniref:hypothetical protein n=1 Tax=Polaromonas sp. CG_9.11 TaxID=2787730 RepID=UPI0018CBB801|nr:hypothetical protein [Polaromonas sp. CG_9.11]MBG6077990.1 hypothetical protein [Polaromonas sp. CG_9.11]
MDEWSEYFEDFPEENPANQRDYNAVDENELRTQQNYSPKFRAREQQVSEAAKARKVKITTKK